MSQAKVSELKNRLSHYLSRVRQGESILVCDRNQVIARLEPAGGASIADSDADAWLGELERRGTVHRAAQKLPRGWVGRKPRVRADLLGALLEERTEGR